MADIKYAFILGRPSETTSRNILEGFSSYKWDQIIFIFSATKNFFYKCGTEFENIKLFTGIEFQLKLFVFSCTSKDWYASMNECISLFYIRTENLGYVEISGIPIVINIEITFIWTDVIYIW